MPIYEYICEQCSHEFEMIQKISDKPITQCPACLQDSAKKLVSAAAFKLKGSGWYETDFKTKKPAETANKDGVVKTPANSDKKPIKKQVKKDSDS